MRRHISNSKRLACYTRDGHKCVKCGNPNPEKLTVDHVIPISLGGENFLHNYQTLCSKCNRKKSAKVVVYTKHPTTIDMLALWVAANSKTPWAIVFKV